MKRIIWLITGVVVAVCLIASVRSFRSAKYSRNLAAEFATQNKSLDVEIARAHEQLAEHARMAAQLQASLQQAQEKSSPPLAAKTSPASKAPASAPRPELSDLMEKNPNLRALFKQSFKANLAPSYQSLYASAHLSPEQIDKFEELMTEAEQDRLDLQAAAKIQGLATNDPTIAKTRQQAEAKLQNAQKEILGDAGYQELERWNRQRPLRGFTSNLAYLVAQSGEPLAAPQGDQLLEILSRASSQYQAGGQADILTIDSVKAVQEAKPLLTPTQFSALHANANIVELKKLQDQFYRQKKAAAK